MIGPPLETSVSGDVLYIEDSDPIVRLVELILRDLPQVDLRTARTGRCGLKMAVTLRPDLIVLDLELPDIPGTEVLAILRGDDRTASIPVIVASADVTLLQIQRLLAGGAIDYLTKPLDVALFVAVVAGALRSTTTRAPSIVGPGGGRAL